jgi:TPR repeat protein
MSGKTKRFPVVALWLSLGAIGLGGIAVAQNANDLRRAAFQMSKESAAAGEFADAVEALQPLGESGDALAQYSLGILYLTGGKDLPQDGAKALAWFGKAADQGQAGAMRQLAIVYEKGAAGIAPDRTTSLRWWDKAANRGDALAQMSLGLKYAAGDGVPKDLVKAYTWLTLAGRGTFFDDEDARKEQTKKGRAMLVAQMSPTEVSSAEKQALQFSAQ